jgi:hypothetical protein
MLRFARDKTIEFATPPPKKFSRAIRRTSFIT